MAQIQYFLWFRESPMGSRISPRSKHLIQYSTFNIATEGEIGMAKKIRFPLEMPDGTQVRTLQDLKEHFDLVSALEYYKSGKLLTWLQDRYLETEVEAIQSLDESAPDFPEQFCKIFGVAYTGSSVDLEEIARRQEKLAKLRTFTDEPEYIGHVDQVAFDQEDLADLLDNGQKEI